MNKNILSPAAALALASLVACGGGSSGTDTSATPNGYWTMGTHRYVDGGYSAASTTAQGFTADAVSTATLSTNEANNGAYSGSVVSFLFLGTAAGVYTVVADEATLINTPAASNPMVVQAVVGAAVATGSTQYTAASGQVTVTLDSAGKFHFSSVGTLPTVKTLDVHGGVSGAPAALTLSVFDAD
jgi:hypothetical protein